MNTKATQLREALEQINEDLLTLSDDIWLNIDYIASQNLVAVPQKCKKDGASAPCEWILASYLP